MCDMTVMVVVVGDAKCVMFLLSFFSPSVKKLKEFLYSQFLPKNVVRVK